MQQLRVALAQIDIALGDPHANFTVVRDLVGRAAAQGANLVVLPELWSSGYALDRAEELAQPIGEGMYGELAALARSHQIAICGSTLSSGAGRPANTATLYGSNGELLAVYSKIHLFSLMSEDQFLSAGERVAMIDAPWGRTALAICYDLRFPELFRLYAASGAGIIILPSEWPHPRLEHWRTLVRARAIENQCFMLACNRVGSDRANTFCGHSMVVDPWGNVLVEGGEEPELLLATLELDLVDQARQRIPVMRDRRPDLYRQPT